MVVMHLVRTTTTTHTHHTTPHHTTPPSPPTHPPTPPPHLPSPPLLPPLPPPTHTTHTPHTQFSWCSCTLRCIFPPVVRPKMLDIMAGMKQRDIYVAWCLWFRLQKTVDFPQLQFFVGRRFSCHGAEADSHGLAVQQTIVIFQLQFMNKVINVPGMQVVQVLPVVASCVQRQVPSTAAVHRQGRHLPFRGAEAYPHVPAVQQTLEVPLLPYMWWLTSLLHWSCRFSGAAVAKTVVLPQLQPIDKNVVTSRAFFAVVVQRQIPMVLLLQTIVTLRCAWSRWSMPLLCRSCCFPTSFTPLSWRRDSFPWSCGPWRLRSCTWTKCSTSLFARVSQVPSW